ncbi:MAG TPA: FkbM family methyltransferase [Acidobacteriaceae bacterium]|nr:FkbM family methyltransferase [Acidobacteriaceae bacterium]
MAALPRLLSGCDRFIDVGANIGLYVFYANRVLHDAEIVAVEANPSLRTVLEESWQSALTDPGHGNRLTIESCAVLDQPGSIDFFVTPNLDDSSVFSGRVAGASPTTVIGRPLDSFYKPSRKTFIKMDIEGAEYRVLSTARRFLSSMHTEFLLELHPWGEAAIKKYPLNVCNLFFRNGFACKRVYHHHHFFRAGLVSRTFLYLLILPNLLLTWFPHRFPGRMGRAVASLHALLARMRRSFFP